MNFDKENKKYLKILRVEIYQKLENNTMDLGNKNHRSLIEEINLTVTADSNKTMLIKRAGKKYRMNSIYNAEYEAETWVTGQDFKAINKVIVVFGFGNGLYIKKILEKINSDDIVIIYEPSVEIFRFVIKNYDIRDYLLDNVYIFIGKEDNDKLRKCLTKSVYWNNLKSQKLLILPQYERLFIEELKTFLKIVKDNNNRVILAHRTNAFFGKIAIENTFSNMKYLNTCNIINDYIGLFPKDVPAIIVAAGPSLDKNILHLRNVNNKAVIFGVDRALEYLYRAGIKPDYAVTIDPIKPVNLFAYQYLVEVPLFTQMQSHSKVLDKHAGKKIFYDVFGYIDNVLNKIGKPIDTEYSYGQSVATAALTLCIKIGFKQIILIGQDLAYAADGRTSHAGETVQSEPDTNAIWVEGLNGGKVKTRLDWYEFLIWFEDKIDENKDKGLEVIDATEGGAKIKGTVVMPLSEAIKKYCVKKVDISKIEKKKKITYSYKDLSRIEKYINNGLSELELIKKKAMTAYSDCEKMIKKCKKKTDGDKIGIRLTDRIMRINNYITSKQTYNLLNSYITDATKEMMWEINQITDDEVKDKEITFVQGKELYQLIIEATEEIKDIMLKKFKGWNIEEM